jgi:predicted acyl esterase
MPGRREARRDTLGRIRRRVVAFARPAVSIMPAPARIVVERDVPVVVRDGTRLRANVFRPDDDQPHPVILCAHPYGKDALPRPRRGGFSIPRQHRLIPQSLPFGYSALTSWESPDPAFWVGRGYVVVNCDLRGWGTSEGIGELLSEQEGHDVHDLVEWAAAQPWSNGRVGTNGVSYLALVQWRAAATRPPHLAAMCVWEGFSDVYADFARPGGVREDGFMVMWSRLLQAQRRSPVTIRREQKARPLRDGWWDDRVPDLEAIDVPALVCGSFSDHELHSRGSFEGFRRIGSTERWLYTHRGPKWATYYGPEALAAQASFFDRHLRGRGDGPGPGAGRRVRVEVRRSGGEVSTVRWEREWPPDGTTWEPLHLDARSLQLGPEPPDRPGSVHLDLKGAPVSFIWTVPDDVELVGPMWVRLAVELLGTTDADLFVAVRKVVGGREVGFEGSYGFTRAPVTRGLRVVSHRDSDEPWPAPWLPAVDHRRSVPLAPGEVVTVTIELPGSATAWAAGDALHLEVGGRWPNRRNPVTGQFPAGYQPSRGGTAVLHTGPGRDVALHVPVRR